MEKQNTQRCKSCILQATAVRSKLLLSQVSGLRNADGNYVLKQTLHCKERMAAILLDFCKILRSFIGAKCSFKCAKAPALVRLQPHYKALKLIVLCNIFVETF